MNLNDPFPIGEGKTKALDLNKSSVPFSDPISEYIRAGQWQRLNPPVIKELLKTLDLALRDNAPWIFLEGAETPPEAAGTKLWKRDHSNGWGLTLMRYPINQPGWPIGTVGYNISMVHDPTVTVLVSNGASSHKLAYWLFERMTLKT